MKKSKTNPLKIILAFLAIVIVIVIPLQFSSPVVENPPVKSEIEPPGDIKAILQRACYDCHSNHSQTEWFDRIAPVSYLVAHDIKEGRERFNFSDWNANPPAVQQLLLWEMVNAIEEHKMPLKSYVMVHPAAAITAAELAALKSYVNSLPGRHKIDTARIIRSPGVPGAELKAGSDAPVSLNGIKYSGDYKTWKVISVTDKYDGGSMRVVYGNDIMVRAIEQHQLPFPDGAKIVKAVWGKQHEDKQGNISPGNFQNVQIMIKDRKKYKSTEGWGFAKFEGLRLKPSGKTALFATTCINCHRLLVPESDFVFNIPTK